MYGSTDNHSARRATCSPHHNVGGVSDTGEKCFYLGLGSGGYLAGLELGWERQFDGVEGVERGQALRVVCERDGLGGCGKLRHASYMLLLR
jgi:hypothetical protein